MMKNSKLRRILLLLACAVLLVSLSVGATLAYLTSTTETVKNTFTVGNVVITLDETNTDKFDQFGSPNESAARDNGNKYNLLPGMSYTKDPQVHVLAGSEKCYVRMMVTVGGYDSLEKAFGAEYFTNGMFNLHMVVDGWKDDVWVFEAFDAQKHEYEFRYYKAVDKAATQTDLEPLFEHINIPGELDNEEIANLANVKINVVAHAIQSDSFADADAAWAAFDSQEAN